VGSNLLATTSGNTYSVSPSAATTYWVRLKGTAACSVTATGGATTSVGVYAAVVPGAIQTSSTTTKAGVNPNVTIASSSAASGGSGNLTYIWRRTDTGTSSATTLTGNDATYAISSNDYSASGTYYFNRYAKDNTCNTVSSASGTYTLYVESSGTDQPQGSCTFTQPPVVSTFANFSTTYTASTYITLTDARDNKNYTVVKIGGRWIMAQNLNYQTGLTWQANSNSPSTGTGQNIALIGSFWCPGGINGNVTTSSTLISCDVWGALYSWETAMMVDGKWSDDNRNSTAWGSEPTYATGSSSGNTNNAGKGANSHGICPPNWHVPTDGEWGDILDAMESGAGTTHNTGTGRRGSDAGLRGKSKCACASGGCNDDTNVSWYYYSSTLGTDVYGFRALPAGRRHPSGSNFNDRGIVTSLWTSSAYSSTFAWVRTFFYNYATVYRNADSRSYGFPVRCIRD
jgi:uncharacterized protein (TIGR02145 family)